MLFHGGLICTVQFEKGNKDEKNDTKGKKMKAC